MLVMVCCLLGKRLLRATFRFMGRLLHWTDNVGNSNGCLLRRRDGGRRARYHERERDEDYAARPYPGAH